jgi:hypothetical protein
MYRKFLFLASLVLASTAHAQMPDRTIMRHIAADYGIAGTPGGAIGGRVEAGAEPESSFRAEVRGDVTSIAWGEAEFGAVQTADHSSSAFVVSLGVCGQQGAILFTRRSGAPLAVGRYRISERANGADEILALVLTGSPTRPTGVFPGQAGWLVVTAASDRLTAGQFDIDAVGFTAAEPGQEDRHVNVSGSFSAAAASSSFRGCGVAE